jgi:hypothetical protein
LLAVAKGAEDSEKLTPAGRIALRRWRARYGDPPVGPDRRVAYAAALGEEQAAVRLFSGPAGAPEGKAIWSSYGGSWRRITIGNPPPRGWRAGAGSALSLVSWILLGLFPATLALALVSSGVVRAAAFLIMAADA